MEKVIVDFYSQNNEQQRLFTIHVLEKIRSQEIISRYLKNKKLKVLDIGGAAGVYSFWLSEQGHCVDLIDLTPKHIEQAKEHEIRNGIKLNSAVVGNACNLPYNDNMYDIVLLMGPMYHILEKDNRILALSEAKRVLKNKGIIFVAAIARYASMFDAFIKELVLDKDFYPIMTKDIECGKHINTTSNPLYFTDAYFHQPDELKNEIEEAGIMCISILPVEGIGNCIPKVEERIKNIEYLQKLLSAIKKTENEASILGVSSHFLGIGKKE
jgi:ubiquinone/menaquinone biosynthesis C-methylase UbiE